MEGPGISVIVPVFNGVRHLAEALRSVQDQDVAASEIIVVDDGSTDGSAALVRTEFPAVRYLYQDNAGPGAARNRGAAAASGAFVAFLDADDLWTPDKLRLQMATFSCEPELAMVFGHVRQFRSPELTDEEWRRRTVAQEVMPGWHAGAMLVRREAFDRVGPFRPGLRIGEFIDWYARAVELGLKQRLLPDIVMLRRLHRDNLGVRALEQRSSSYLRVLKAALDRRRCGPS